jgi:hypothetical protein
MLWIDMGRYITRENRTVVCAKLAAVVCSALGSLSLFGAESDGPAPKVPPVARAFFLAEPPSLDGRVLDDRAWQGVKALSGFWQTRPNEGTPATQKTEVYVGYTRDALYIGAVLRDDEPEKLIAASSRRDADLDESDSFLVVLDSFRDRQNGFVFGTNPAGAEYDGQVTKEGNSDRFGSGGGSFNLNWDTTWVVKTVTSDLGWSTEMMIPFKSLRYGSGEVQTWGVNFQRNILRNNEVAYWAPLDRQHNLHHVSQAGSIEAIRVQPQRNLKLTPYVLGKASRGGVLSGTDFDTKAGFDVKYSLTPSLTLDATYQTDFAQVETDELQLNLDRFSLFIPERRQFFLENSDRFSVGVEEEVELFFSRRIGIGPGGQQIPIDGGVRLSGRIASHTNLGLLQMRSDGVPGVAAQNDYTVVRVDQELPGRSSLGALVVNRNGDGSHLLSNGDDYNRTYAVDGRWGVGPHLQLNGYFAKTETPGLSGRDRSFAFRSSYSSEKWSVNARYTEVGDAFNPEAGFLSRTDYRKYDGYVMRRLRPDNLWRLYELRPHISYRGYWDFNGFQKTGYLHADNHWEWKNGHEIHTGTNFTHEGVSDPFPIVSGVIVPAGTYDHQEAQIVFRSDAGEPMSGELRVNAGGYFGGDRVSVTPTFRYRTGEKFSSEFSLSHNRIDLPVPNGSFDVNLARMRLSYSFSPRLSIQGLLQYDDQKDLLAANLRFAWLQSANTGLYLVYGEVDDRRIGAIGPPRREFIVKYSRIFDLLR